MPIQAQFWLIWGQFWYDFGRFGSIWGRFGSIWVRFRYRSRYRMFIVLASNSVPTSVSKRLRRKSLRRPRRRQRFSLKPVNEEAADDEAGKNNNGRITSSPNGLRRRSERRGDSATRQHNNEVLRRSRTLSPVLLDYNIITWLYYYESLYYSITLHEITW